MSNLKKIRVQHVDRDAKGVEIKTDVDVITDADCITMDDGDLRSGVKKMIDDRIGEVIDGAPEQLDTLKEIATELEKNQSGVSTIIKAMNDKLEEKDLTGYAKTADVDTKLKSKVSVVNGKGLSTNDYTNNDKVKVDALDPLSSDKKIVYKQKRNTDFNNLTEAGFYTVQTSTNAPHNQYNYWSLIVLNSTSVDHGSYVQQIAINEMTDDRAIYMRKKSSNWTSWIKLEAAPDLSNLVTKVDGKGLSSNDFTNSYKQKLDNIPSNPKYTDTTYDLSGYAKTADVDKKLRAKVEAVNGKGLSTNDYTNEDKEKLSNLSEGIKKIKIDDLNDLTEEGDYIVDTIKNGPVPNKELTHYDSMLKIIVKDCIVPLSFYIKVTHHIIWTGGKAPNPWVDYICIRQVAICDDIYIREKGKDNTWTPWTKLASTDDLKNLKLADLKDDEKHRTVTDEEKKKWNDKAIELDKSGMGEARIKKLIKCMADPDYLFSNNKDLYKDLNDIYGTNFNSSTTDIYKLLKSGEEIDKLVNNADLCVSFAKSKYLIELVYSDSFWYKILDKLSHNFDMFKAFFNNKSVINELSKESRDLMLRAGESLPLDDSRYAEAILNDRKLFFEMSDDTWSYFMKYLISSNNGFIVSSEDRYKRAFKELLTKRPTLLKRFLNLDNNDDFKDYASSYLYDCGFMYNTYCLKEAFTSTGFIELVISHKMYDDLFRNNAINNNTQCLKNILYNRIKSSNLFNKTVVVENNLSALNEKCKTDNSIIFIEVLNNNNNNAKVKVKHKNNVTAFIDSGFRDFNKNNKQEIVELSGVSYTGCTFESNGDVKVLCEIYTAK